ncbi:MAG: bifunctional UDP-sugar hydrolase/5'-nucleotidase [Angelakisella sp.]
MEKQLKIYYTSDTHGFLFPTSYLNREDTPMGLFRVIENFKKDGNTLVLDGGDTTQGSPLTQYIANHPVQNNPIAMALNAGGYDYITLGNHDFNHGHDYLASYLEQLNAVCLCANVKDTTGRAKIQPTAVRVMENGLRVGITGIVTDHVKVWERAEHLANIEISDPFQAAEKALAELAPICDVTVCIYHGGFECDLDTGELLSESSENVGYRICKELSYDLLLTAHQHLPIEGKDVLGTYVVQPPASATRYLSLDICHSEEGVRVQSTLCPAGSTHGAEPYNTLLPLEEAVQLWLDEPVGKLDRPIPAQSKLEIALHGSAVADFFNTVQLDSSGADFSCASLANDPVGLPQTVTMRDVVSAYRFPNTLTVLEVDERVLRTALERCAEYLTLEDGQPQIAQCFLRPKEEHYNYDFFAGLTYEFDLRQPVGQRVTKLQKDGKPLENRKYTLCMNNYRASGTGGYDIYRSCPVLGLVNTEVPELAAAYLQRHETVQVNTESNLSVVW